MLADLRSLSAMDDVVAHVAESDQVHRSVLPSFGVGLLVMGLKVVRVRGIPLLVVSAAFGASVVVALQHELADGSGMLRSCRGRPERSACVRRSL
jgi:hypothetical protein